MKNLEFLCKNLIAHRGFFDNKNNIPENSILAFKRAIQNNYIIELDIHILKDNKIVVFHDDNLKRMTGVDKKIKDCSFDEIRNLKLLDSNEKIPLFSDVLKIIDGKVPILIELKYDVKTGILEKELLKELKNYNGKYALQCFNPASIYWFKKNAPQIVRGQLSCAFKNKKFIKRYFMSNMIFNIFTKPDFISYDIKSIDKILHKKTKDIKILAWTVKNKKEYEKYVEICDNLICENFNFIEVNAWKKNKYSI